MYLTSWILNKIKNGSEIKNFKSYVRGYFGCVNLMCPKSEHHPEK